jgi:hypothetical protein
VSDSPKDRPAQLDSPLARKGIRHLAKAQVWAYRRTNGRIGGRLRAMAGWRKPVPVLLLDHAGRSSGARFTTPLLSGGRGDACPDQRLVELYADFETYQTWTDREIPVVVLSPR